MPLEKLPLFQNLLGHLFDYAFHAALKQLLDFQHKKLNYPFQGLDRRLTGVTDAKVIKELLA